MKSLFLSAVIFIACSATHAQDRSVSNPYPKTINVSGSADMEIVPDEIYVQVDLKEYKKKGENKVELEKIKADFLSKCKSAGIEDSLVSIASYEGTNYNYWLMRRQKKNPDMFAGIAYQIKFRDSKKMDQLVELLDDEATANFRIVKVSHSKMTEYRKQLKIQAIKAAREKGIYLSDAINEKMGEAITITEPEENQLSIYENEQISQFSNTARMANAGEDFSGGGVDFRKIKIRYEVNVVFALK